MNTFCQGRNHQGRKMRLGLMAANCAAGILFLLSGVNVVAQPSITVGSATMDPGDSIIIPIEFVNNGQVVGMNFDITFDPEIFPGLDLAANCDGLDMGPGTIVCANPSPGIIRFIIHTLPLSLITSAQVGTIELTSDGAAPAGNHGLVVNNVVMSNLDAEMVTPVELNSGLVGINATGPVLDVQPALRNFGSRQVGTITEPWAVFISNRGSGDALEVLDVALANGAHFIRDGLGSCPEVPFELAAGTNCVERIRFAPQSEGQHSDTLTISSNAETVISDQVGLIGTGIAISAILNVDPVVVDFGIGYPATPADAATIMVSNAAATGAPDLPLASISLEGDEVFSLAGGTCSENTVLVAGEPGCSILVQFAPAQTGSFEALLEIVSGELSSGIELHGQGEELDLSNLSDTIVFMGEQGGDGLGGDLWVLSDISGDGAPELLIGAPGAGPDGAGATYLLFDPMLGLGAFGLTPALLSDIAMSDGASGVRIDGESGVGSGCMSGDEEAIAFGYSIAGADGIGSVDGATAFAVSAPGWAGAVPDSASTRGVVYVLSGARAIGSGSMNVQDWMDGDDPHGLRVVRRSPGAPCIGAGLTGLGDIDRDGFADLIIGEIAESIPSGAFSYSYFIVYGRDGIFNLNEIDLASTGAGITQIVVPYGQGTALASAGGAAAGDFNDSGFTDFVITAPNALFASQWNDTLHAGAAFIFLGDGNRLPPVIEIPNVIGPETFFSDVVVIFGPEVDPSSSEWMGEEHPRFGAAIDFIGNVNGDSYDDLVIGSGGNALWPGTAYLIFGTSSSGPIHVDQLDGLDGFQMFADPEVAGLGEVVIGPGDITGNGLDDVVVGAPGYRLSIDGDDLQENAGKLFIVSGVSEESGSVDFALNEDRRLDLESAGVRSISLAGLLPAQLLQDVRFGFRLTGFGADVTGNDVNDFAVSAPGGYAAGGPAEGGWVFVVPGQAVARATDLSLRAYPLHQAGLPGRFIAVEVTNVGEEPAEELVLTSQLHSAQALVGALSMATGCRLHGEGAVRMVCDVQARWQCETEGAFAECRLSGLEPGAASSIVLRLDGDGAVTLSVSGAASNSDEVDLDITL